jgi:putative membrane-bound dehydrogenase-like protein
MNPRSVAVLVLSAVLAASVIAAEIGTLPLGKDGKPLNLDFEDGTLRDWTATGDAFKGQPVRGPISQTRKFGEGKVANHQGDFWIGGYELLGDEPKGTLTSAPFKVTHPFAAFRLGGGSQPGTRVELVRADTGEVFFRASGHDSETMLPVVVDLASVKDREIFIRLVDELSPGWGHINFDDFRFYETRPEFPRSSAAAAGGLVADTYRFAGLPPEQAAKEMTLPPGFRAQLFAGEPDVKQPIAFAIDDRGRLWVAEAYTYPRRAPEGQGKDRILVFEDTNGDGKFDRRTVFMDGLNLVSGIEVGFGGVWVGAAPYLMFIPMKDGDEPKPAGEPQILLDGWGFGDTHETLNTFTWGPDGWLYGCHGVFTQSNVGKPGAPESERTRINAGVWRFHPVRKKFEVFAEGTSNPWGIDFNDYGQCIIEACVIPHLWHIIQGAHYQRQAGEHFSPFVYDDIKTIADHVHYAGSGGPHAGNGKSDSAGGGHAHAGLMVYLGASWPEKYRGAAFMNNIHGARINMDTLAPQGSGYAGHHAPDFIMFNDSWSQIINLQADQDGSVFMIDWYDRNQCHNNDPNAHDRTNGRIFKIVYGETKTTAVDLQKKSDDELAMLLLRRDEWLVRHARRILQERAAAGKFAPQARQRLRDLLGLDGKTLMMKLTADYHGVSSAEGQLRAMWGLHAIGGLGETDALQLTRHADPQVRAWALQLACENGAVSDSAVKEFARLAKDDPSSVVRLYLASAAQRLAPERRWDLVAGLHAHGGDAGDHNLPLMDWYALEPLTALDFHRALGIALDSKLPRTLEFTARRIAALGKPDAMDALVAALRKLDDEPRQLSILTGITAAIKGQHSIAQPAGWDATEEKLARSASGDIRALTQALALAFGSSRSLTAARSIVADPNARRADRERALSSLLNVKDAALPPVLLALLRDPEMRAPALRGLAAFADAKAPDAILAIYATLSAPEKRDALLTLVSRASFAQPLLAAIADGRIPARDVTADIARNIRALNNAALTQQLEKTWGTLRETPADKLAAQAKYKALVLAKTPAADDARGRIVFTRTCAQCHTLFGEGGKIGPDITGANRGDLDYLLHNIIDPNAEIPNQYRVATVELNDGRVLSGIANQQDAKVVSVASGNEVVTVPRSEIKKISVSEVSMMPEGLLTPLTDQEVRDLLTYLRSPMQVPPPAEPGR